MSTIEKAENETDNNIGDKGAETLSEALKVNTTLTELDLWGDDQQDNSKE